MIDFFLSRDSSGGGLPNSVSDLGPQERKNVWKKAIKKERHEGSSDFNRNTSGYVVDLPHPAILSNTLHQTWKRAMRQSIERPGKEPPQKENGKRDLPLIHDKKRSRERPVWVLDVCDKLQQTDRSWHVNVWDLDVCNRLQQTATNWQIWTRKCVKIWCLQQTATDCNRLTDLDT